MNRDLPYGSMPGIPDCPNCGMSLDDDGDHVRPDEDNDEDEE